MSNGSAESAEVNRLRRLRDRVAARSGLAGELIDRIYRDYYQFSPDIAADLEARHELSGVAIHHRVGRLEIGEASVVIAVSAPHRQDALAACHEAIDTLKETVPLWKKEVYEGGEEWIGRGS